MWLDQLTVTGSQADVHALVQAMRGVPESWGDPNPQPEQALCFNRAVPVPAQVAAAGYNRAGYDWCNAHWGTKWEPSGAINPEIIGRADGAASAFYGFDTAWCPPDQWFSAVVAQWPTLAFGLRYAEPDTDLFGEIIAEHGQVDNDTRVDPSESPDWIAEHFAWVLEMQQEMEESFQ